jgi:hypothetical protein
MGDLTSWLGHRWFDLHQSGHKPVRADFDPVDLARGKPGLLPHLWLLDVETEPLRFRYRLIGGAMTDAGGVARVGDYVDQFDTGATIRPALEAVHDTGHPWYRRGPPMLNHDKHVRELEALMLPLHGKDSSVEMLLNCTVYYWQDGYRD